MSSRRVVTTGLALVLCAILALPDPGYGRFGARTGSQSRGGSHLHHRPSFAAASLIKD
jgi:hypothetical protein